MKIVKLISAIALSLIFSTGHLMAQDVARKQAGEISISYSSFGANEVIQIQQPIGSTDYKGKGFYSISINYARPLKNWLRLETGIRYSQHSLIVETYVPHYFNFTPEQRSEEIAMINLPVVLKAHFLSYFFVNGGLSLDIDISEQNSVDEQIGFGGILGLGAKYHIAKGLSLFINPYAKVHSLVPLQADKFHGRLAETGIRFGLSYNLKSLK